MPGPALTFSRSRRRFGGWASIAALGTVGWAAPALAAGLVRVVAAAKASVVAVGAFDPLASPRFSFRGTGFVVGDGRQVVTNFHVLPGDEQNPGRVVVMVPGAAGLPPQMRDATLTATSVDHDLALLTLTGPALPALPLSARTVLDDGTDVAMIGFPLGAALGLTPVTHRGIIAATTAIALPPPTTRQLDAKTLNRLRQGPFDVYQLDATAYPGNSGSPLLDAETGEVLGVVNMVFVKGTKESALSAPSGISYAIPVRHVVSLIAGR
jgi:S1-C subfamily serine protease